MMAMMRSVLSPRTAAVSSTPHHLHLSIPILPSQIVVAKHETNKRNWDTHNILYCHQQQQRLFSTRTRRRRVRGEAGGASSTHDTSRELSPDQFQSIAYDLLDKVESSLRKLLDCNDGLEIKRHPPSSTTVDTDDSESFRQHQGQLSIIVPSIGGPYDGGTYLLTIHSDENTISLQCLSGNFTYIYNTGTGEWVGQEDGHSLLGILTRDWIRQCHGVPDF
jgi:hypothetical protein